MFSAAIQIDNRIVTTQIPSVALPDAATMALRAFWATLPGPVAMTLNHNVNKIAKAVRAPETLRSQIALRVLWATMADLGIEVAWDAHAVAVRWAVLA